MRYHVIGSDIQVRSLAVAGVQGTVVTSSDDARSALESVLKDKSVGTVLVSSVYYDDPEVAAVINEHDRKGILPVIMKLSE